MIYWEIKPPKYAESGGKYPEQVKLNLLTYAFNYGVSSDP